MNKNIVIITLLSILSLLCYKIASTQADTVENFWGLSNSFVAKQDIVDRNGNSVTGNNQAQLCYNANPYINTNIMAKSDVQTLQQSLSAPGSPQFQDYLTTTGQAGPNQQQVRMANNDFSNEPYCGSCTSGSRKGPVTYTVPGTYESYLPPRFNSVGLEGNIRYEIPQEKNLGGEANNPLMVANSVQQPQIREEYHSKGQMKNAQTGLQHGGTFKGDTPKQYNQMYDNLSGEQNVNKLPVASMNNAIGDEKNNEFFVNSERLIFALNRSRLQAQGDFIRGDLPVVPYNPNSDPGSGVWFRPSVSPSVDLRAGAMNVIAGVGNVTAQQTSELQMRATGGQNDTFGGVPLVVPDSTAVGRVGQYQQQQLNNINMGNQAELNAQTYNPNPSVSVTSFP
jgi:hypothetical protein